MIKFRTIPIMIFSSILIVLIGLLFFYLSFDKKSEDFIKQLKLDFPGRPSILAYLDYRNGYARSLLRNAIYYIESNKIKVNLILAIENNRTDAFKENCLIIDGIDEKFKHEYGIKIDNILFFNEKRKPVWKEELSFVPFRMKRLIDYFVLKKTNPNSGIGYLQSSDNLYELRELAFMTKCIPHDKSYVCFYFYDDFCMTCRNNMNLLDWNELQNRFPNIKVIYVSMFRYDLSDIAQIKRNYALNIDILIPDDDAIIWWKRIGDTAIGKHPILGLIIVADKNGNIVFISKEIALLRKWLEYIDSSREEV